MPESASFRAHPAPLLLLSLLLLSIVACTAPAPAEPDPPPTPGIGIRTVDGAQQFFVRSSGERFVPRGHNYVKFVRADDPILGDVVLNLVLSTEHYDRSEARADLRAMRALGFNVVRVMLETCSDTGCIGRVGGYLNPGYLDNIADLLELARDEGVYVWLTSNTLPDSGRYVSDAFDDGDPDFLTQRVIDTYARYYRDLLSGLVARDAAFEALFSFELRNEHWYDLRVHPWSAERGTYTPANGVTYDLSEPADKRRMAEEMLIHWADATAAAVREVVPELLVSIGFFMPNEPFEWRPGDFKFVLTERALRDAEVDFFDLHSAPAPNGLSPAQAAAQYGSDGVVKPLVMGETSAFTSQWGSEAVAAQALVDWQVGSCAHGYQGWLVWHWEGDELEGTWGGRAPLVAEALAPSLHPDPCEAVEVVNPNLAYRRPVTASASEGGEYGPESAVDGLIDTWWTAPPGPPQWIEIDLEAARTVGAVRLPIGFVTPPGPARIRVLGRGEGVGVPATELHLFEATLREGDVLERVFDPPLEELRYVRFEVEDMAGWVILHELEVLRP